MANIYNTNCRYVRPSWTLCARLFKLGVSDLKSLLKVNPEYWLYISVIFLAVSYLLGTLAIILTSAIGEQYENARYINFLQKASPA